MNQTEIVNQPYSAMPEVMLPRIPDRTFTLTDFGAVGDGQTDNSEAFRSAIQEVTEAGGGRLIIPVGLWLTGPLKLTSRLELHAEAGATVLFSKRFEDYPLLHSQFEGKPVVRCQSPLDAEGLEDIAITGGGIFDGGGEAWRPVKKWKMTEKDWNRLKSNGGVIDESAGIWWPSAAAMQGAELVEKLIQSGEQDPQAYVPAREYLRPNLLSFRRCSRILLEGATFQNSAAWNLHPWASEHMTIRRVNVRNPWFAQNGDGLDVDSCRYVLVEDSTFDVGDDAICIKSGKDEAGRALGMPAQYVTIRRCTVYHGHGGFVIGSEMSGGVSDIHVTDCTFIGTDIGLRFKSARGRGGIVERIRIERIRMTDIVGEAISFHLFYEGVEGSGSAQEEMHPISEQTPVFRQIVITDIDCAGANKAFLINGLAEMPLEDVTLRNYRVSSVQGVICHNVKRLLLEGIDLKLRQGPPIKLHQAQGVCIKDLTVAGAQEFDSLLVVTGERTEGIEWEGEDEVSSQLTF
ncbi:glycoside hydrolase family 28 protein [Paenibacillus sp. V4I7]|uniref:glycoside hydrolase family 28 protein n=1 Tax=Paenibacillus sp. V4I7 TaxID=3042307 RepID=UPI002781E771|nr:glycoside hydrolase family 28 protein [Paenibacillus sp. V4I7]MDQ0900831.1 polygalacturonase [Paenibacillus sp. V4I7]